MATITKTGKDANVRLGSTPWGNKSALHYSLATNASGAVIGGNSTAAVANGDKVRIGLIPAGMRIYDSQVLVNVAMSASVIGDLGFEYADGVDDTAVPQSANVFGNDITLSSAARLRNATTNKSVKLPKAAWLILTTAGANNAKASDIEITLDAIAEGND